MAKIKITSIAGEAVKSSKSGRRETKVRYTEMDVMRSYQLYAEYRKLTDVSKETGIPMETLKVWKRKYHWQEKVEQAEFMMRKSLDTSTAQIQTLLQAVEERLAFEKAGTDVKGMPATTAPKAMTIEEFENVVAQNMIQTELFVIRQLDAKAAEALRNPSIMIRSWPDLLKTYMFIFNRFDTLFKRMDEATARRDRKEREKLLEETGGSHPLTIGLGNRRFFQPILEEDQKISETEEEESNDE